MKVELRAYSSLVLNPGVLASIFFPVYVNQVPRQICLGKDVAALLQELN